MTRSYSPWTEEEKSLLSTEFPKLGRCAALYKLFPGHSRDSICNMAGKMRLTRPPVHHPWSEEQRDLLRALWNNTPPKIVTALLTPHTKYAVYAEAKRLGMVAVLGPRRRYDNAILEALKEKGMSRVELEALFPLNHVAMKKVLQRLKYANQIKVVGRVPGGKKNSTLNVWGLAGRSYAEPEAIVERMRAVAGNPFGQLML